MFSKKLTQTNWRKCILRDLQEKKRDLSYVKISIKTSNHNPSLLLRRFVLRMADASAKRVTGDEPQGTMGRVQTPVVSFPPSFARTF